MQSVIYRGYDIQQRMGWFHISKNGGPVLHSATSEENAQDWIDVERKRLLKGKDFNAA